MSFDATTHSSQDAVLLQIPRSVTNASFLRRTKLYQKKRWLQKCGKNESGGDHKTTYLIESKYFLKVADIDLASKVCGKLCR